MFSGIIEAQGVVTQLEREAGNLHLRLRCPFAHELKIDQSIAHNGACLTVVKLSDDQYTVTAIEETLQKTNLGSLRLGDEVNLERCLRLGDRLDGHIVQGHVDTTAECVDIADCNGSWAYTFRYHPQPEWSTVSKGSICVNGVSLTVVDSRENEFSVHVIPYTREVTNLKSLQVGGVVNLEFDMMGKYVWRYLQHSGIAVQSGAH